MNSAGAPSVPPANPMARAINALIVPVCARLPGGIRAVTHAVHHESPPRMRAVEQTTAAQHLDREALEAGLDEIRQAPSDHGRVELIVCRPEVEQRKVLAEAVLDTEQGLVSDCWRTRGSSSTADGSANPDMQLTLMNARSAALVAVDPDRRQLAGDQLFVDLDLSVDNLPPGSRLRIGDATVEISAVPHRGCGKFQARFGIDALKFVNSPVGRQLNLRGVNARVVAGGIVRPGDAVSKVS
ncbi:MAG TPA: hypothetical protein VH300_15580 [Thermoleophilaceae bacterium]|nr:hypothetical protein [Thermoleophilaceae bacterium]